MAQPIRALQVLFRWRLQRTQSLREVRRLHKPSEPRAANSARREGTDDEDKALCGSLCQVLQLTVRLHTMYNGRGEVAVKHCPDEHEVEDNAQKE